MTTFKISKRDAFQLSPEQQAAGVAFWRKTGQKGQLCSSSMDAEALAPKTWLIWVDSTGREHTIECELHVTGRASDPSEGVGMLHGMCPVCGECFISREDNKQIDVEYMPVGKAPRHIRQQWRRHCRDVLGIRWSENDKVPVVSSPERWLCDYCHSWCVKVTDGVAVTDTSGAQMVFVPRSVPTIGREATDKKIIV